MLVDINLLVEKEKKNYTLYIALFLIGVVAIIGGLTLYLQYGSGQKQVQYLQKQIEDTKLLRIIQEDKLIAYNSSSTVTELETAITWTEELPIPTVFLLRHLASLLPERGFVLNFNYSDEGSVNITVQFDTSREAAYYLKSLKDSEYIVSVDLTSLVTTVTDDEAEIKELTSVLMPRYLGQFNIELNKPALRAAEKEAK